jgi:hypothetical protein
MRSKSGLLIIIIVLTITVGLVALKNSQAERSQRQQLVTDLDLLIESYKLDHVNEIDISTITAFEWEELYLFAPYSTTDRIVEVIGLRWSGNHDTVIESNDGIVLFLFVNKNKVVQYMDFHRDPDFVLSVRESSYSPSEAVLYWMKKEGLFPTRSKIFLLRACGHVCGCLGFQALSLAFIRATQHSVHPTGGSLRVFKQFAWPEVGSGKVALPCPTHQRVTHTVRRSWMKSYLIRRRTK